MEIIGFGTAVWKLEVTHMEHNISWRTIMASSPAQSAKLVYRSLPSSVVVQRDSPCSPADQEQWLLASSAMVAMNWLRCMGVPSQVYVYLPCVMCASWCCQLQFCVAICPLITRPLEVVSIMRSPLVLSQHLTNVANDIWAIYLARKVAPSMYKYNLPIRTAHLTQQWRHSGSPMQFLNRSHFVYASEALCPCLESLR